MAALVPVNYTIYRNGAPIISGVMNGAAQINYQPPDASPATYTVSYSIAVPNAASTSIGQRGMSAVAYKR